MSKRLYPSGSEKRKRAAYQKEIIEKLPKLTSFFTKGASVISNQIINYPQNEWCQQNIVETSESSSAIYQFRKTN